MNGARIGISPIHMLPFIIFWTIWLLGLFPRWSSQSFQNISSNNGLHWLLNQSWRCKQPVSHSFFYHLTHTFWCCYECSTCSIWRKLLNYSKPYQLQKRTERQRKKKSLSILRWRNYQTFLISSWKSHSTCKSVNDLCLTCPKSCIFLQSIIWHKTRSSLPLIGSSWLAQPNQRIQVEKRKSFTHSLWRCENGKFIFSLNT